MTGRRERDSTEFKAEVAPEGIKGELTITRLTAQHGVHQTLIDAWKRQAIEGPWTAFSGKAEAAEMAAERTGSGSPTPMVLARRRCNTHGGGLPHRRAPGGAGALRLSADPEPAFRQQCRN